MSKFLHLLEIKVENYENKENELSPKYSIYGDIWIHEIDKQALKFFQKVKELEYKEIPIKKVKNYWYTMMETFWENVLLMDKNYGFNQLEYWSQIGQLEIEDFFIEFNAQTKGLSKSDNKATVCIEMPLPPPSEYSQGIQVVLKYWYMCLLVISLLT